jgi:cysteinyl-tRNA synthetase
VSLGYDVTLVINITDVDDKLIDQAKKQNTTVRELAERVTADYVRNLEQLVVTGVDHMPRATEHIGEIIEMIGGLIDKGFAYPAAGDVYFDVLRDPDYGKLCHRDPEQLEAGARIEVSDKKRNPGDFALWKAAKPGEPSWDSPWGKGRPGWHIECSAMSMRILGETLDIHGGGLDLQFPHHENELAQSESYTGRPFVRYWMHNGLMKTGTEKMSKSKGNEIVVSELLKTHDAETLRFLLLSSHYRSPIEYSEDRLRELRRALEGFYGFFDRFARITGQSFYELDESAPAAEPQGEHPAFLKEVAEHRNRFIDSMDDDFNTAGAIGALYELLSTLNRFADAQGLEVGSANKSAATALREGATELRRLGGLLGMFRKPLERRKAISDELAGSLRGLLAELDPSRVDEAAGEAAAQAVDRLMATFIQMRADARKAKNFALADQIRQRLTALGIALEDRRGGTDWKVG